MEIEHSAFDGIIGGGLRGRNPQESCGKRLTFDDLNAIFHCQSGHKLNELLTELYEQTKKQRSRRSIWPVVNIALQRVGKGSDFYGAYCRISGEERDKFHDKITRLQATEFTIVKSELFRLLSRSLAETNNASDGPSTNSPRSDRPSTKRSLDLHAQGPVGEHIDLPIDEPPVSTHPGAHTSGTKRLKLRNVESEASHGPNTSTQHTSSIHASGDSRQSRISREDVRRLDDCRSGRHLNEVLTMFYEKTRSNRCSVWTTVNLSLEATGKSIQFPGGYSKLNEIGRTAFHAAIINLEGEMLEFVKKDLIERFNRHDIADADHEPIIADDDDERRQLTAQAVPAMSEQSIPTPTGNYNNADLEIVKKMAARSTSFESSMKRYCAQSQQIGSLRRILGSDTLHTKFTAQQLTAIENKYKALVMELAHSM